MLLISYSLGREDHRAQMHTSHGALAFCPYLSPMLKARPGHTLHTHSSLLTAVAHTRGWI